MKNRLQYFDIAKAYLIILVIIGHILIVLNPNYSKLPFTAAQEFIYAFHMSAFFIIHGVLINGEKWKAVSVKKYISKRAYSLLVPYIFFELLGILCRYCFYRQDFQTGLYNMLTVRCNVGADWFLPAMFIGTLLFIIYIKHSVKIYGVLTTIACFVIPMFLPHIQLAIVVGRGLLAYGFIMVGYAGKQIFTSVKLKKPAAILISFAVTAVCAVINLKWGGNDYYLCTVGNPVTLVVGGASGTIMTLGISRILQNGVLTYVGRNSLIIMGTHQLVIYAMTALIPRINSGSIKDGLLILVVIIMFEIPIIWILDRFLPFVVGKKRKYIK